MYTLAFADRDIFWPPADELIEAAERIRARLGEWPRTDTAWRVCLTPPDAPCTGDLIVVANANGRDTENGERERWLAQGAGVLEADTAGVRLALGSAHYALAGAPGEDWIPALASFLDCGFDAPDALVLALAWRDGDESHADDAWPSDLARFPQIAGLPAAPSAAFAPCPARLGLYPVVPSADWVERLLALGVKTVQLRVKAAAPDRLADEIARSVAAGRRYDAAVFINDYWREAIAAGAYGVHLGQEDLDTAELGAIATAGLRLGLSTHGYYELLRALRFRPSYVAFGAVFPTRTKALASAPQGLGRLARLVRLLDGVVPFVAIGGIDASTLPAVAATGVGGAALVRAVTEAPDTAAAIASLSALLQR
jgi:thiamine-phosphate pyrophosphorylase